MRLRLGAFLSSFRTDVMGEVHICRECALNDKERVMRRRLFDWYCDECGASER